MPIGINPVRPDPFERRDPRSQDERNMDKIFKALSIANAGMGIGVNFQKFQEIRENRALAPAKEAREARAAEDTSKFTQAKTAGQEAITAGTQAKTEAFKAAAPGERAKTAAETKAIISKTSNAVKKFQADQKTAKTEAEQTLFNDFRKDARNQKLFDSMDNASRAYTALVGEPGAASPLQVTAAQRMIIRSIEPGIINQADLEAYSADPSAMARMQRFHELQREGKALEPDAKTYKDFAFFLQNKAADDLRMAGRAFANSPSGKSIGATGEVMDRVLRVEDFVSKAPGRPIDQVPGQEQAAGAGGIPLAPQGAAEGTVTSQLLQGRAPAAAPAAPTGRPDEATFNATVDALIKAKQDAGSPITREEAINQLNAHYGRQ